MHPPELGPAIGPFVIEAGASRDYRCLERFHYRLAAPRTWAQTWIIRDAGGAVIAVGVLSFPVPALRERDEYFQIAHLSRARRIEFVNAHLRTISRVIVHPQYRALGVAGRLVRHLCLHAPTRYVEAIARMARAHPLFDRAGMKCFGRSDALRAPWYLFDRCQLANRASCPGKATP